MNQISNKSLYRSRKNTRIAGVCGGIAEYFNTDPTLVRILFLLFLFLGGSAILIYIICWIVMPLEPI